MIYLKKDIFLNNFILGISYNVKVTTPGLEN